MATVSISVPDELKKKMDAITDFNWSAVARKAFEAKIHQFEMLEKFSSTTTLTEDDAIRLGRELNARAYAKRHGASSTHTPKDSPTPA